MRRIMMCKTKTFLISLVAYTVANILFIDSIHVASPLILLVGKQSFRVPPFQGFSCFFFIGILFLSLLFRRMVPAKEAWIKGRTPDVVLAIIQLGATMQPSCK